MAAPSSASPAAPRRPLRPRFLLAALAAGGILLALLAVGRPVAPPPPAEATLGFAWPEFRQTRAIHDPSRLADLSLALARARRSRGSLPDHLAFWRLSWRSAGGDRGELVATRDLRIWDPAARTLLSGGELRAFLARETTPLRRRVFGQLLPWSRVDSLWPWDGAAVIRDVETGASLRVLRYGGYEHADAEPATPRDTAVLKALYGGRWSWRRRAVVVEVAGRRIAASINGMPHGEGVVSGNAFPGHFCVHFAGSVTHGSGRADPAHGFMILKAAGLLPGFLENAPPARVAEAALVAVFQRDAAILRQATDRVDPSLQKDLFAAVEHLEIHAVRAAKGHSRPAAGEARAAVEADVTVYARPEPDLALRGRVRLRLLRLPAVPGWKVHFADLAGLLAPAPPGEEDGGTADRRGPGVAGRRPGQGAPLAEPRSQGGTLPLLGESLDDADEGEGPTGSA